MESHNKKSFKVKLNPHITIYSVEEKMVPVSLLEKAFEAGSIWYETNEDRIKFGDHIKPIDFNEWFEQNVK